MDKWLLTLGNYVITHLCINFNEGTSVEGRAQMNNNILQNKEYDVQIPAKSC